MGKSAYITDYDDTLVHPVFDESKIPRPIKKYVSILKNIIEQKQADKVIILTARGDTKQIIKFLKSQGIISGLIIRALGSSDPMDKARYIEKYIKNGYDNIIFVDNATKNIKAANTLKDKYPNIKLIIHQVEKNQK